MNAKLPSLFLAWVIAFSASVFAQSTPSAPTAVSEESKYEIRGIIEIGDQPQLSIYYAGTQLGWLKPGQKKGSCKLVSFDSKTKEAVIDVNGQEYRIKQSQSEVSVVDFRKERTGAVHQRVLDMFDTNKDGQIDDDERRAMMQSMREGGREAFQKMMDLNGDGVVSEQERQAFEEYGQDRRAEMEARMVQLYDKDGDGKLSPEERREAFRQERERSGGGGPPPGGGDRRGGERREGNRGGNPPPSPQTATITIGT